MLFFVDPRRDSTIRDVSHPAPSRAVERRAPHVDGVPSGAIAIAVPLRTEVPAMWMRFFAEARPRRPPYSPTCVQLVDTCLRVTCSPHEVGAWLACIDLWIEEANERYATYEATRSERPIDRLHGRPHRPSFDDALHRATSEFWWGA